MFSKNDPRPNYNPDVLKEAFQKENRAFTIYEDFKFSMKAPITGKFYSKYQQIKLSHPNLDLVALINSHKTGVPKQRYIEPITSNQVYGWVSEPLLPLPRNDYKFYKPKVTSITKIQFLVPKA